MKTIICVMALAPAIFINKPGKFAAVQHLVQKESKVASIRHETAQDNLTAEIAKADSLLFDAFNRQDIEVTKAMFTPDLEFFHDKDGLAGYQKTMSNFADLYARNKTSELKRELIKGSMEVYPIKGYGALEVGEHRFCHFENGQPVCGVFKFAMIWVKTNNKWQIRRAFSYDHSGTVVSGTDPLYLKVLDLDKNLFNAFNKQQLDGLKTAFAKNLEFYQDDEGLENYDQTIADFKTMFANNANSNLRRDLVPGSVEVYPFPGYGAIETGTHKFTHTESGQAQTGTFKFINIWHQETANGNYRGQLAMGINPGMPIVVSV